MDKIIYGWKEFEQDALSLACMCGMGSYAAVFGVPRGGCCLAVRLSDLLRLPLVGRPGNRTLVVDEVIDSGKTRDRFYKFDFACLHVKNIAQYAVQCETWTTHYVDSRWIVYPWERSEGRITINDIVP